MSMNIMKQRYELAKKVIEPRKEIILRLILPNGNLAERRLSPNMHHAESSEILYNDTLILYRPKNPKNKLDIFNIDYKDLIKVTKEILPPSTTSQGVILHKLETLFESGYQIIH